MSKEAMQMALDALLKLGYEASESTLLYTITYESIEALRAALSQPDHQPFAHFEQHPISKIWEEVISASAGLPGVVAAYTASPQRKEWVGLTDGDKQAIFEACYDEELDFFSNDAALSMAEAKLKEKNT